MTESGEAIIGEACADGDDTMAMKIISQMLTTALCIYAEDKGSNIFM